MNDDPPTKQRRGAPLVSQVLETALAEIARVGHESLSIEEVAARAGVNKTTIWRRWPTPEALALSAFEHASDTADPPDTGSLRGDLADYLHRVSEVCRSPAMLSLVRMKFRGTHEGKLGEIIKERFARSDDDALSLFTRAIARGELPRRTDVTLLRDIFLGSAQYLILLRSDGLTPDTIDQIVAIFLDGVTRMATP